MTSASIRVLSNPALPATRVLIKIRKPSGHQDLASRIGVVFKRIEGGAFFYQGRPATGESFEAAETVFTISMLIDLLNIKEAEVNAIFSNKKWPARRVIIQSLKAIAPNVPDSIKGGCPLVFVNKHEAEALARLLKCELLTEYQWERAASGTDGKPYPWVGWFDNAKAVRKDCGTRPVKSKPRGMSPEGLFDLIGLVWEWTSKAALRGGSFIEPYTGQLSARSCFIRPPVFRSNNIGFRLARPLKSRI